jgi:hypothetical protein
VLPPRTLLLTATPPNPGGVGGIILADLCAFLPPDRLAVAYVAESELSSQPDPDVAEGIALRTFPVAFQRRPESRFGRVGRAVAAVGQGWNNLRQLSLQVQACAEWSRERGVEQVWAVLDSPLTVAMAEPVAAALGVPLRVTIWDDIHHNNRYFALDRLTAARSVRQFAATLRASRGCAVIGESMREEYQRVYGVDSVVVRHGVAPGGVASRPSAGEGAPLLIGFAGSVTARSAFDLLLATLDRLDWRLDGRPVVLRLLGHRFDLRSSVPRRMECLGWRSVEDSICLLGECDFNYLPQPFEPDWKPFARLSFPSKLTTYLAAGRPLLLHSPPDASLPPFNTVHRFASACTSLDGAELEQSLRRLLDPNFASRCIEGGQAALAQEFSRERFRTDFAAFLELPATALNA